MLIICNILFQILQEEGELLKEMEVTGQAYEDKQEQNIRLVQQLKEKDDANFKLMSEVRVIIHCSQNESFKHNASLYI